MAVVLDSNIIMTVMMMSMMVRSSPEKSSLQEFVRRYSHCYMGIGRGIICAPLSLTTGLLVHSVSDLLRQCKEDCKKRERQERMTRHTHSHKWEECADGTKHVFIPFYLRLERSLASMDEADIIFISCTCHAAT